MYINPFMGKDYTGKNTFLHGIRLGYPKNPSILQPYPSAANPPLAADPFPPTLSLRFPPIFHG